jgi:hypothetical protein
VPLDQLYLSWQTVPCSREKIQIFFTAVPRKVIDSLVKTLHKAGLVPVRMTIKPLALTKLVPVNTAIIIDVQPGEFDIIILSDGIAQPIRTVNFSIEEQSLEDNLEMVTTDLERTVNFFNTNNPEKTLNDSVPVYVSGDLIGQANLQKILAEILERQIIELSAPFQVPEQMNVSRYIVNEAMIAGPTNSVRYSTFHVANMNVLPAHYLPKPISLVKVLGIPTIVVLISIIVLLVMYIQNTTANISAMQSQLNIINQTINQMTIQKTELKKEVKNLESQANNLKMDYDTLQLAQNSIFTDQEHINGDLNLTLNRLPANITLNKVTLTGDNLEIEGTAPDENNVYVYAKTILYYARQLDLSHRYSETTVTSITIPPPKEPYEGPTIEFKLTFQREN